jgi:chromosome segregation ATPase
MGEEQRDVGAQVTGADDPEAIRAKIEETRGELGDTVAALSYKTDVKARTRDKVEGARAAVTEKADELATKADELATKAQEAMPPAAQERVAEVRRRVRRDPRRAAAVVGGALGGLLVLLRLRRRG